jgi:hypothetical protein
MGLSTLIFTSWAVLILSLLKGTIPTLVMQILNIAVGALIIGYGVIRLVKLVQENNFTRKKQV